MVCYCEKRRIIYIHLPKCAGLTIETILLQKYDFKHFTFKDTKDPYKFLRDPRGKIGIYKYILKYSNEAKIYDLNSFQKFTFIRNPYTKAESSIRYLHKNTHMGNSRLRHEDRNYFPMNIKEFYYLSLNKSYFYMHFCLSQTKCLEDLDGNVDFIIGRFENLMDDLKRILFDLFKLEVFEIENVHVNKSDKDLLKLNTEEIKKITIKICNDDFINFGYEI